MLQVIIYIFLGAFFGGSFTFLIFSIVTVKDLKQTKRLAMFSFYKEILNKKQDTNYEYSHDVRRIINSAHLQNMSKWTSKNN